MYIQDYIILSKIKKNISKHPNRDKDIEKDPISGDVSGLGDDFGYVVFSKCANIFSISYYQKVQFTWPTEQNKSDYYYGFPRMIELEICT